MTSKQNSNFETFTDKWNYLQRVTIIFLGVSFFFFFMILIPYFSLKVDGYHLFKMDKLIHSIIAYTDFILQKYNNSIKQTYTQPIQDKANDRLMFYNNLTSKSADNEKLRAITSPECLSSQLRTPPWLTCNLNAFDQKHQNTPSQNNEVRFNASDIQHIKQALGNISTLMEDFNAETKSLPINTAHFADFETSLKQLNGSLSESAISTGQAINLQADALKLNQDVKSQDLLVSNHTDALLKRFDVLDLPLVGKIPMGFNEMVAVFPIALAIVYLFFITIVRDTIRLRKILEKKSADSNVNEYLSGVPVWLDPRRPKCRNAQTLHLIVAWTVLAVPAILFVASVVLILYVWDQMYISDDKFPAFMAAADLNKYLYRILYGISSLIFIVSYVVLIKEVKN